jgi:phospholipase, patatin family
MVDYLIARLKCNRVGFMGQFKVLSLDGGGIRGLYSACFLRNLVGQFDTNYNEKSNQHPDIGKAFQLICGTSTGSILTCALAAGIPITRIVELYKQHGKDIFPKPMPAGPRTINKIHLLLWCIWHSFQNPAQKSVLHDKLAECFKEKDVAWLHQFRELNICVPSIKASNYHPVVFKTPHSEGKHLDNNTRLIDVCLASSAAPIFFPLHVIELYERAGMYIDGGLWANNPSLIGLLEALELADENDEIVLISLGTCDVPVGHSGEKKLRKGLLGWKGGIEVGIASMTAQAIGTNYVVGHLCRQLRKMGRKIIYYRFEEGRRGSDDYSALALDKASKASINRLQELARDDAAYNHHKILDCISKSCPEASESLIVKDIFSNMIPLSKEEI